MMSSPCEAALLVAKWVAFYCACGAQVDRYMGLKAFAIRCASKTGVYDRAHHRFLRRVLLPGQTVFDVGANFGAYSLALASIVGERGQVVAFEPIPWVFRRLVRNVRNLPQTRCVQLALSDEVRAQSRLTIPLLFRRVPEPALASCERVGNADAISIDVPVSTIDVVASDVDELAFIKIDVEGHELTVLSGAHTVLSKRRPLVLFECNDVRRLPEFIQLGRRIGYMVAALGPSGRIGPLGSSPDARGESNFYLVPEERREFA